MGRWAILVTLLAIACGPHEPETYRANSPTGFNVVLVTLDGVRWQELFIGADPLLTPTPRAAFPLFWQKLAGRGETYGDLRYGSEMTVATQANASLPGYMSMFAESQQGCVTNGCGRISVPTFLDRLRDELSVPREQLRVNATWSKLQLAVSSRDDVAMVHAGDAELPGEDQHPHQLQAEDALEFDRTTVTRNFDGLERHPRFLYLSLLDSDRFGHQGDYPRYLDALSVYDHALSEMVEALDASGEYGRNTAIIVTTDHGRGLWDQWSQHGPHVPSSGNVWAFVMAPPASTMALVDPKARVFTHHDVRYTIETVFGLSTSSKSGFSSGFIEH